MSDSYESKVGPVYTLKACRGVEVERHTFFSAVPAAYAPRKTNRCAD